LTSESLEVLVTEGKVSLEEQAPKDPVNSTPKPTKTYRHTELVAGQRAVQPLINKEFNPEVFTVTSNEIESRLAWKDQILDFDSRSLSEVVNEFNRHNYTQIVIGDEALNELKVTIALKPDNYEGLVKLLELSAGVEAEETDYGTIVLRKR
jgi:ferric-dicitrate binding protein FerR (iron transport regulator)